MENGNCAMEIMEGLRTMSGMDLFQGFYKGKRILITGHTGFKGSWLSLWLTGLGARVTGFSLGVPTHPALFTALYLARDIDHRRGDIRNYAKLRKALTEARPQIVFHLAAQALVLPSYREPRQTYETNVMGTVNLLEAVREIGSVRALVNVTSDKCYQNRETRRGYREDDPLGGGDPYSSSKGCSELVTTAYRRSFFGAAGGRKRYRTAVATARAGNVIGGGDWAAGRLVPDCVRSLRANRPIMLRNPNAVRPWQHVLDPLCGYLQLAKMLYDNDGRFTQAWNFGPNDARGVPVRDVVSTVIKLWGHGRWRRAGTAASHEAVMLRLNTKKSRALLKWRPVYPLPQALKATVEWYRNYHQGQAGNIRHYSERQIEEYCHSALKLSGTTADRRGGKA